MAQGGQAPAGFPEGLITWHKQSSRCTRKCGGCFLRGTILNALRVALRIISGKIILNFGTPERLRTLRCSIFTGGVVTKNGSCSAAFCESAALRESFLLPFSGLNPLRRSRARFPLLSPAVTSSPGTGEVFPLRESQAVKFITKVLGIMRKLPAVLLPLPLGEVASRSDDGEGAHRCP